MRLSYGAIEGSERLRAAIAALYETASPDDVIVAHGAIGANALAYQALVEPGDVVIPIVPTYQQHTSIPESLGAEVRPLRLREEDGWLPDLDELRRLAARRREGHRRRQPGQPDRRAARRGAPRGDRRHRPRGRRLDPRRRGLPRPRPGGARHVALVRGPLRAHGGHRQHVQGVLARGPAARLDRGAARGARGREPPPRLLGDQRGHGGRPARLHRPRGARRAAHPQPRDRAREPRDPRRVGGGRAADRVRAAAPRARPRCSATTRRLPSEAFCLRLLEAEGVLLTPGSAMDAEGYLRIGYANDDGGPARGPGAVLGVPRDAGADPASRRYAGEAPSGSSPASTPGRAARAPPPRRASRGPRPGATLPARRTSIAGCEAPPVIAPRKRVDRVGHRQERR